MLVESNSVVVGGGAGGGGGGAAAAAAAAAASLLACEASASAVSAVFDEALYLQYSVAHCEFYSRVLRTSGWRSLQPLRRHGHSVRHDHCVLRPSQRC